MGVIFNPDTTTFQMGLFYYMHVYICKGFWVMFTMLLWIMLGIMYNEQMNMQRQKPNRINITLTFHSVQVQICMDIFIF